MASGNMKIEASPVDIDHMVDVLGNMPPEDYRRTIGDRITIAPNPFTAQLQQVPASSFSLRTMGTIPSSVKPVQEEPSMAPPMRGSFLGAIPPPSDENQSLSLLHRVGSVFGKIGGGAEHVLGKIGRGVGDVVIPDQMKFIPGTEQHEVWEQIGQERRDKAAAELEREREQGAIEKAQADLEQQKANEEPGRFATSQADVESQTHQREALGKAAEDKATAAIDKNKAFLANLGYKVVDGQIVQMGENELSPEAKAKIDQQKTAQDYVRSGIELREAQAALENAKNDPNSPVFKQAQQRVDTAQANVGRAQAMLMNAYANTLGTTPSGEALPGAPTDLEGHPIGLSTYRETGPTGQQRTRGQFARDIIQFIDSDVKPSIEKAANEQELGPVAGRLSNFLLHIGDTDPAFVDFMMNSELMKGGTASVHFGARGSNMGFQEKLAALLSPNLNKQSLNQSVDSVRKLMELYARSGGRSVTQPALPGETKPTSGATHRFNPATGKIEEIK